MATANSTVGVEPGLEPHLHGQGPSAPPPSGSGGGEDRGPGDAPGYYERLRRCRLGLGVGLASVVMLFVGLSSAYIVRQGLGTWDDAAGAYVIDWRPAALPDALLLLNTAVLLASSFTLEMARRSLNRYAAVAGLGRIPGVAQDRERSTPWLGITLVLGVAFLTGQVAAWREMQRAGLFIATNPSSSFFYVLTGTHAVHLFGGLVALVYAALTPLLGRPLDSRRIALDVTGWYWHFMAFLWLYIFGLLHFSR